MQALVRIRNLAWRVYAHKSEHAEMAIIFGALAGSMVGANDWMTQRRDNPKASITSLIVESSVSSAVGAVAGYIVWLTLPVWVIGGTVSVPVYGYAKYREWKKESST